MARLGLGPAWTCAFANDFDPLKAATYRANFEDAPAHFHEGDVWAIEPAALPPHADLAWASSPCQDFSLAGARAGLAGGRSSAFFGFWRLIQALGEAAPRAVVIENVSGLLTSHGGADFTALCQALADQGYAFGALEIDAARFTPQSRPRVFVMATRAPPARPEPARSARSSGECGSRTASACSAPRSVSTAWPAACAPRAAAPRARPWWWSSTARSAAAWSRRAKAPG